MARIWTVGYEGHTPETLQAVLEAAGIERVIDVREAPVSRKPGFTKKALEAWLADAGIAYEVRRDLGAPKPVRDRYKQSGDWHPFAAWYRDHLTSVGEQVAAVALEARRERCCLLCFEADPQACHRSLLAEALEPAGVEPFHL